MSPQPRGASSKQAGISTTGPFSGTARTPGARCSGRRILRSDNDAGIRSLYDFRLYDSIERLDVPFGRTMELAQPASRTVDTWFMDQDQFLDLHIDQLDAPGCRKGEDDDSTLFDPYAHIWPDEQTLVLDSAQVDALIAAATPQTPAPLLQPLPSVPPAVATRRAVRRFLLGSAAIFSIAVGTAAAVIHLSHRGISRSAPPPELMDAPLPAGHTPGRPTTSLPEGRNTTEAGSREMADTRAPAEAPAPAEPKGPTILYAVPEDGGSPAGEASPASDPVSVTVPRELRRAHAPKKRHHHRQAPFLLDDHGIVIPLD